MPKKQHIEKGNEMKLDSDMKVKFGFIYNTIVESMKKLDNAEIGVDEAKAMSALAKQANNVLVTQLDACKFISNNNNAHEIMEDVGL